MLLHFPFVVMGKMDKYKRETLRPRLTSKQPGPRMTTPGLSCILTILVVSHICFTISQQHFTNFEDVKRATRYRFSTPKRICRFVPRMVYRITKRGGDQDQEANEGLHLIETRPEIVNDDSDISEDNIKQENVTTTKIEIEDDYNYDDKSECRPLPTLRAWGPPSPQAFSQERR